MEQKTEFVEQKRLFLGARVDCGALVGLREALKKTNVSAKRYEMEVKWVPVENFHITLKFLGETEVSKIPLILERVSNVAKEIQPFQLSIRGMGAFPESRYARVLWMGVQNRIELRELQEKIETEMTELEFGPEEHEYRPHLTIGRLRKQRSVSDLLSPFVRKDFGKVIVGEVVLFESILQGNYPKYLEVGRVSLG